MRKLIASIYFDEVTLERPLYGGFYKIPPVAKGGDPFILVVDDKVQQWAQPNLYKRQIKRDHIDGLEIALDIIKHWTQMHPGMTASRHPGIWMVRDVMPVLDAEGRPELDAMKRQIFRTASDEERKAMWDEDLAANIEADANWAEYRIQEADTWYEEPKTRAFISPNHRLAARHYGRERLWLRALKDNDIKACPYCKAMNAFDAMKCNKCTEIIDPHRYAEFKRREKEILKPPDRENKFPCGCGESFATPQEFARHKVRCSGVPEPEAVSA